nr:MAG: Epoxyqueuosine reductase [Betaproteobacteria bacterium ADurb.Bin341]
MGGLYTTLSLPPDSRASSHCGSCTACLKACPTQAIVAPYQVDARRCISYLTIEYAGSIPKELRPLIGQRIYGCDDCQLCCPWNRFARIGDPAFVLCPILEKTSPVELFAWSEADFNKHLEGSPIRRIGHERWLRNLAIALGNTAPCREHTDALGKRLDHPSPLVREHVAWALAKHTAYLD